MNVSKPVKLLDLDSFLPIDGEDRFDIEYSDGCLSLNLWYEHGDEVIVEKRKVIRFDYAKYFVKTPFPGVSLFKCADDRDITLLHSLVEYGHSDILDVERIKYGASDFKHYRLFLHSSGIAFHIIARAWEILDL